MAATHAKTGGWTIVMTYRPNFEPISVPNARRVGPLKLLGVNIAGLSFGSKFPGVANTDYFVPGNGFIDYWAGKGATCLRLCFSWERVQPTLLGPLDPAYLGYLSTFVSYATGKGVAVILDLHNYGKYQGVFIGTGAVTPASFADLWGRLASVFASNGGVLFGLMNEPEMADATAWLSVCKSAIGAIRTAGARQTVLLAPCGGGQLDWLPGDGLSTYPAALAAIDPANNTAVEVHRYFDAAQSGTDVVAPGNEFDPVLLLSGMTGWARRFKLKAFLGETGFDAGPTGLLAMSNTLAYLQKNSDVWLGCTLWSAGPGWPDGYVYTLEPIGGKDRPQVRVLTRFTAGGADYGVSRPTPGPKLVPVNPVFGASSNPAALQCLSGGTAWIARLLHYKTSLTVTARFSIAKPTTDSAFVFGLTLNACVFADTNGNLNWGVGLKGADGTAIQKNRVTTAFVADGATHAVAWCADHTGGRLFLDGKLIDTAAGLFAPVWSDFGLLSNYRGNEMVGTGTLSHLAVFDSALFSAANPPLVTFEHLVGNEPGLIVYAPLDGSLRTSF